jgi:hypothetical protein
MIATLDPEQTIGKLAEDSTRSLNRLAAIPADDPLMAIKFQAFKTAVDMWALHKISVLSAQGTDDLDEIARIWSAPLRTFNDASEKISQIIRRIKLRNPDLEDLQKVVIDLRDQAQWVYELHAGGNLQATT